MKKSIPTLLFLCFLTATVLSQPVKTFTVSNKPEEVGISSDRLTRIDKTIEEYVSNKWIPGAVVLIIRNGKIVVHKAYGYSDVENKIALKRDDIFRIASQSKAVTSLAVMMLWEEGKFLLDEPISKYIPEFKNHI
jgi:CubicO group peptidase (beta-lactamase class C family)